MPSIAALLPAACLFFIASLSVPTVRAEDGAALEGRHARVLPRLGNTVTTDRPLMREIGDDHVYEPIATAPAQPSAATPDAVTPGAAPRPLAAARAGNPGTRARARSGTGATGTGAASGGPPSPATAPSLPTARASDFTSDSPSDSVAEVPGRLSNAPVDDAWARIRASTRWTVSERPEVLAFRERYVGEALYVNRLLARADVFIDHLVERLHDRYLPLELALLPAIESGFRPDVTSHGNAAGLWQIVPVTAREIGLQRDAWFDGRADIVSSTRAALDYLSYLNAEFHGDWELTLAAYNAGPGRVRSAIRRNREQGEPTDFWSLPLPAETRDYVPKLLALVDLVKAADSGLILPERTVPSGFVEIEVGFRIGVAQAAGLAGVPDAELRRLNAGLLHGVTAPDGPHRLNLPAVSAARFRERLAGIDGGDLFSLPLQHDVVPGDTLGGIAQRYGIDVQRLMELNGLGDTRIRIGQTLNVIDATGRPAAEIEVAVSIGDTLSTIAARHSVDRTAIRDAQGEPLPGDLIHPGDILVIRIATGTAE